jgi:outer membrane lipoprotein-sorting protein
LFAGTALAQAQPDAAEILAKVKGTWKDLKSYEVEFSGALRDPKTGKEQTGAIRIASVIELDRYRMESRGYAINSDPPVDELIGIYDGATFWIYAPKRNEYRTEEISVDRAGIALKPSKVMDAEWLGQYIRTVERFANSRFLREETISIGDGGRADCFVIGNESGETIWIDKSNHHVLRAEEVEPDGNHATMVISINMNERLSDELFKFVPPPGARNLRQL